MPSVTKAVFLVAGWGTRFLPATKAQPKEMFPLIDKPVIQYLVEEAVDSGIQEIILVTAKHKRSLEDHFDYAPDLEQFLQSTGKSELAEQIHAIADMARFTVVRQKSQRGLGDALLAARHLIGNEPVVVYYGDDLVVGTVPCTRQLITTYEQHQAPVFALERAPRELLPRYGVIGGNLVEPRLYRLDRLIEKPRIEDAPSDLIRIGRYIITPDIMRLLETVERPAAQEFNDVSAFMEYMHSGGAVYGYEYEGERYDCGDKLGFLKATVQAGLVHEETGPAFRTYLKSLGV